MRIKRKWMCGWMGGAMALLLSVSAQAAQAPLLLEQIIGEEEAILFVQGASHTEQLLCQISGEDAQVRSVQEEVPTDTLFLVDVSTSINQQDQKLFAELMPMLIDQKPEQDRYAVMSFGEQLRLLCEPTSDRWQISKAVEELQFNEEGTGLYSAVAGSVEQLRELRETRFGQIVVFSDGLDLDENGITWDELSELVKRDPIPVHTLGFRHQNNAEGLKGLFALARQTGGYSATLDRTTDLTAATTELLGVNQGLLRIEIEIPQQLRDGSNRTIGLLFGPESDRTTLTCDVRMPLSYLPQAESVPAALPETPPEVQPEVEPVAAPVQKSVPGWIWIALGGVLLVALIVVVTVLLLVRRSRKARVARMPQPSYETIPKDQTQTLGGTDTQLLGGGSGETQVLIDSGRFANVVLIDLNNPLKKFEQTTQWDITVGRDLTRCNLVLDYDKSISKRHCRISARNGQVVVCDLGSSNKTFVNGQEATTELPLHSGDVLGLGRLSFTVTIRE